MQMTQIQATKRKKYGTAGARKQRQENLFKTSRSNKKNTILRNFVNSLTTIKGKCSEVHEKANVESDFMLIVKDSLHDKKNRNSSRMAQKYICYGAGPAKNLFLKGQLKFKRSEFYMCKNSYDYSEDEDLEVSQNNDPGVSQINDPSASNHPIHIDDDDEDEDSIIDEPAFVNDGEVGESESDDEEFFGRAAKKVYTPGSKPADTGCVVYGKRKSKPQENLEKQKKSALEKKRLEKSKNLSFQDTTLNLPSSSNKKVQNKGGKGKGGKGKSSKKPSWI